MTEILYQHGTLALLVPGLLTGAISMQSLLQHGDTGIGTGEGLDGELIILDGQPYQINGQGQIQTVAKTFTMPFADIHWAHYQPLGTLQNLTSTQLYQHLTHQIQAPNVFYSVKIQGQFQQLKARSVNRSEPPYATLTQAAQAQHVFQAPQATGTLLSYYAPQLFHGAAVAGYHSHFLAADHSIGGHVLDFSLVSGQVEFQIFDTLQQHFPIDNSDYMQHDFAADELDHAIRKAES